MDIKNCTRTDGSLLMALDRGMLRVQPMDQSILRVTYTLREEFKPGLSLMRVPYPPAQPEWDLEESGGAVIAHTGSLRVAIDKHTGSMQYFDREGRLLMKEPDRGGKTLIPTDVVKTVFDKDARIMTGQNVDGMRANATGFREVVDRKSFHAKLEFEWQEGEALYGLGSHEEGYMNLRGTSQYLYQQNFKAVVPSLVSTNGYGIILDCYGLATFRDDIHGSYLWSEYNDELDYYFVYGPEMDQVVSGFRKLTGHAPMLPRWAFGYVQSKERYKSQEELVSVVQEYRSRGIPLDCIVLDWMSWTGELWGQKSFDPERFPDPAKMMEDLHKLNARLMVSIWPIMKKGGENHAEMLEQGSLLGNQATYNAFDDGARALYWKQAYEGIFRHGTDAWWCDCTEPFEADWNGEHRLEPEQRLAVNTGRAKRYLDPQYINAYSLLHSGGIYEGQRANGSEKRVVNLTRSAYLGQQRYAAITWSGDIAANWATLRRQIPAGLNFAASGCPYWTLDIGAFFVKKKEQWFWRGDYENGCDDLGYRELYVRWFQLGAFLPMFRSHGTDTPREVWRFGEPGSATYDTLVKFDRLRYRLLPYLYSLAGWVTHRDYTMLRALAFDFRHDRRAHDVRDQFLCGPAFLVCPVTEPMYYDKNSVVLTGVEKKRAVYLPEGAIWHDFWSGRRYEGGRTVVADAPLEVMPLFVRAGSIVPMGPRVQQSGEGLDAPLELRIYPGASGSFELYEDEGDGYGYEQGRYSTIAFTWDDSRRRLAIGARQGAYPGMAERRRFRVVLAGPGRGIGPEECTQADHEGEYAGEAVDLAL